MLLYAFDMTICATVITSLFVFPTRTLFLHKVKENCSKVLTYNPARFSQNQNISPLCNFLSEGTIHFLSNFSFNYLQQEYRKDAIVAL